MITKITEKEKALIPQYIQKWVDLASQPIDRIKIKEIFKKIYKEDKVIIVGESFQNTFDLIRLTTKGKKLELDSQLRSQLSSQLRSQLRSQLSSQLRSQLRSQLYSQLYSQLDSQLRSQLSSQLYSQLDSQLRSQLSSQLSSQLRSQLYSQLRSQLDSQSIKYSSYISYYFYDWAGYYDYAEKIGVNFDKKSLDQYFEILLNIPIVIFIGNIIFVCEKPCSWEKSRLHSEIKPAISWKDGTGLYYLNGVNLSKDLWQKIVSKTIPTEEAIKLENQEHRTLALQYIGGEKLEQDLGGIVKCRDIYGELIELTKLQDLNGKNYLYYKAIDPSKGKHIYLRTHPDITTPTEAMTRAYRLDRWQLIYQPISRT